MDAEHQVVSRNEKRADKVFTTLRHRIANQDLPPGSKLRESQLSKEFGVSRAYIREVFGGLEQRGLIERIPNRGAVVARLGEKQVFEVFDVRESLEALCARLAAQNAPEGAWDTLIEKFGAPMDKALEEENFDAIIAPQRELRETMAYYADNHLLTDMLDLINDKIQVIARRVIILPGRAAVGVREHRELLDALKRGDAEAAERSRRQTIAGAREHLRRYKDFVF